MSHHPKHTYTKNHLIQAPKWLLKQEGITQRQWKQRKRADVRNLRKALKRYAFGSAYVPAMPGTAGTLEQLIDSLAASVRIKRWG